MNEAEAAPARSGRFAGGRLLSQLVMLMTNLRIKVAALLETILLLELLDAQVTREALRPIA